MEDLHPRKKLLAWLVFAVFCSIARHVPFANSPFDGGRAGEFGGRFQGSIQEVWEQEGFFEFEGRPTVWPIPTDPITGVSYCHHPLLFHYMERFSVWRLGLSEFALRLYPLIGAAVTFGILVLLAFYRWGQVGALVMLFLQLMSDGLQYYGSAANYDSVVTAFILGAIVTEQFCQGRTRLFLVFLFSFLGMGHEWSGGLIAAGILGKMICSGRFDKKILIASLLGSILYAVIHLAIVAHWEGGLARAIEIMLLASSATGASEVPGSTLEFLGHQVRFLGRMWGGFSVLLLIAPIFFRRAMNDERQFLKQTASCWVPIYLVWILMFPARSWDHEGWSYLAHPGIMLVQTAVLVTLLRGHWNSIWRIVSKIAVLSLLLWGLYVPMKSRLQADSSVEIIKKSVAINRLFSESDFIVSSRWTGGLYFYLDSFVYDAGPSPELIDDLIGKFKGGEFPSINRFILTIHRDDRGQFDRAGFEARNPGFVLHHESEADFYILAR